MQLVTPIDRVKSDDLEKLPIDTLLLRLNEIDREMFKALRVVVVNRLREQNAA